MLVRPNKERLSTLYEHSFLYLRISFHELCERTILMMYMLIDRDVLTMLIWPITLSFVSSSTQFLAEKIVDNQRKSRQKIDAFWTLGATQVRMPFRNALTRSSRKGTANLVVECHLIVVKAFKRPESQTESFLKMVTGPGLTFHCHPFHCFFFFQYCSVNKYGINNLHICNYIKELGIVYPSL